MCNSFSCAGYSYVIVPCWLLAVRLHFLSFKIKYEGCCYGCDVKHPNDAAAYTGGQAPPWGDSADPGGMEWKGHYETVSTMMI